MNTNITFRSRFWSLAFLPLFIYCSDKKSGGKISRSPKAFHLSNTGNDDGDGSIQSPWKTIDKLNTARLRAGDSVCFKGGQVFRGSILVDSLDSGDATDPVTITSFGESKATVDAADGTALTVTNARHIRISHLRFTGAGRKTGNTKDGVIINQCTKIEIDSIDVDGFQKAGLFVQSCTDSEIKRVYARENGFAGIYILGQFEKRDCSGILVSHCTAENNPGDPTNFNNHSGNGILAGSCKNINIEYCVATNNGWDMPKERQWSCGNLVL